MMEYGAVEVHVYTCHDGVWSSRGTCIYMSWEEEHGAVEVQVYTCHDGVWSSRGTCIYT